MSKAPPVEWDESSRERLRWPFGATTCAHAITEKLARRRFNDLLDAEHAVGSRHPKGHSLYQVVCRGDEWVGLVLWIGAIWHIKARDLHLGWDRLIRCERLPSFLKE